MDNIKRRSVLRKSINNPTTPRIQRRISFSGKNLVREFHNEEEPKTWNNSYEISDHLNVDETTANVSDLKKKATPTTSKESLYNNENATQDASLNINSEVNVNSPLSTTNDFINLPCQNSETLQIGTSIDITLYGREKYLNQHQQTLADDNLTTTNLYSFVCDEYEKDLMRAAKNDVHSEQIDTVSDINSICSNNNQPKDPVIIYTNDSMSCNNDTHKTVAEKRKTINRSLAMEFTRDNHYDKENIAPTSIANITENQINCMDIDSCVFGSPTKVNVEKESQDFQHKLNKLSFLQDSDDNMQTDVTQTTHNIKSLRPTINFNRSIDESPVNANSNSNRQTIHFNEDICPATPINFTGEVLSQGSPAAKGETLRKTINFNEDIRVSPDKLTKEMDVDQKLNIPSSVRKTVVVRKICTAPLVNKSGKQIDLDQRRILRFKKKLEQDTVPTSAIETHNKHVAATETLDNAKPIVAEKSFNMSLSSVKNLSLSSDSYSPIIPSEFKVLNFKQLNDEIERGKIHLYSNAPKTPNTDRKKIVSHFTKNINFPEHPKQSKTLIFENADIPDEATADDTLTFVKSNNYFDLSCKKRQEAFANEHKSKAKCRYSQADDMMLDNTSFLTRAKIGDETASRNSSKRDVTQMNNIDILFDETLKESATKLSSVAEGNSVVKTLKGNNEKPTQSSMFDNAKPILRQTITSLRDDDCMQLYEIDDTLNMQKSQVTYFENNSNEANKTDKKRKTMHLNDDIDLCDNQIQMEKSLKNITIYHDNNMNIENENIDIQNNRHSAENMAKVKVTRKTLYLNHDIEDQEMSILNNESKRSTIFFKNDIATDEKHFYSTQEQRQKHARHTMHFENENIENDVNAAKSDEKTEKKESPQKCVPNRHTFKENEANGQPVYSYYNIEHDHLNASNHKDDNNMNIENENIDIENERDTAENMSNVKVTRKTLYLNQDIEDQEMSMLNNENKRSTIFFKNDIANINAQQFEESNEKHFYSTQQQRQKHARHTMHFENEDIESDINAAKNDEKTGNKESPQNVPNQQTFKGNEAKGQTVYPNDNIEHDHLNVSNQNDDNNKNIKNKNIDIQTERNTTENLTKGTRKTLYLNHDIDDQEMSILNNEKKRSTIFFKNDIANINDQQFEESNEKHFYSTQQQRQKHTRHTMHFENEDIESDVNAPKSDENVLSDQNVLNKYTFNDKEAKRQTVYSNDNIDHDDLNPSNLSTNLDPEVRSINNFQQTMILDSKVDIDNAKTCMSENGNKIVKSGKTLHYSQDLNESLEKFQHTDHATCAKDSYNEMSPTRKNIHTAQLMDISRDDTKSQENYQNKARKSIHIAQCMDLTSAEFTDQTNNQKVSQARKSIYNTQCMDFSLNTMESKLSEQNQNVHQILSSHSYINTVDNYMRDGDNQVIQNSKNCPDHLFEATIKEINESFEGNVSLVENAKDVQTNLVPDNRKTLHFYNNIEIATEESFNLNEVQNSLLQIPKISSKNRKTIYYEQKDGLIQNEWPMNDNPTITCEEKVEDKKQSIHFDKNNDISIEEYCTPTDNCKFPANPLLNIAKRSLPRNATKSLYETPRTVAHEIDMDIYEFEAQEILTQATPVHKEISMKRLPANLTPIVSMAKKRQTLLFDSCSMDEEKINTPVKKTCEQTEPMTANNNDAKHLLNDKPLDSLGVAINESVVLKTPSKQIKSRIPVPLSSGKKPNKSFTLSNNSRANDTNVEEIKLLSESLELKDESIDVLRRATTFTQRRDTDVIPINNQTAEIEFKQGTKATGQPSIFEGNPITISDVSVFYTAQRNSNACLDNSVTVVLPNVTAPLPDVTIPVLDVEAINMTDDLERKRKESLQKRYINLTYNSPLDNIEQTRLCLVRTLSDDDDDDDDNNNEVDKQAENQIAIEQQIPITETIKAEIQHVAKVPLEATSATVPAEYNSNVENLRFKRRSINDLRNISAVCQKCKRCQNTFLNETTSSSSDSFVLPEVPPLPDLGLDRLKQIRKGLTIADVHVLWQRMSLDRTVINDVDDSRMLSDTEDDSDLDESLPIVIAFRQSEQRMQEFERKLAETFEEKKAEFARRKSFVLRLAELLRNTPNLVFNYQMQIRGFYLFSHAKILTISIVLNFEELDPLGMDINLKSVEIQKSFVPEKIWKPIDYAIDFQLKLNLPYDLQSICEGSSTTEAGIFKMLQTIDQVCVETYVMGNELMRVVFDNHATLIRDQYRTYVRKINRKIVNGLVEKTEVRIELLNIKKLSFKDITAPPLHHFREEIHLLPIGLKFLDAFLPNPLNYFKK